MYNCSFFKRSFYIQYFVHFIAGLTFYIVLVFLETVDNLGLLSCLSFLHSSLLFFTFSYTSRYEPINSTDSFLIFTERRRQFTRLHHLLQTLQSDEAGKAAQ